MKTAERILLTALELFNEHGENSVTSVDIAMELDISPGNLYYHYKGKEVIIDALVALHKKQMMSVLSRDVVTALRAEDVFYYLYILIEKLHLFRFLYRSQADLLEKYPSVARPVKQLLLTVDSQLRAMLDRLIDDNSLKATQSEKNLLAETITLILTQTYQADQIKRHQDAESIHYHALSMIMVIVLPRLTLAKPDIDAIQTAIDSHTMANLSSSVPDYLEAR
ncbi:TetR/AcrR family transcriptional regulator [Alteromonas antoniana]|uniref:TetR/AcrR family transcriptional regulator n=1 Tax=Alteromonas antoniana TaxID=2803813 RepID=UPI001C495E21|nr:TetR/AcrR family transcriptional regulator [Alteromonas antoniana]